jgi:hypothetical protein
MPHFKGISIFYPLQFEYCAPIFFTKEQRDGEENQAARSNYVYRHGWIYRVNAKG